MQKTVHCSSWLIGASTVMIVRGVWFHPQGYRQNSSHWLQRAASTSSRQAGRQADRQTDRQTKASEDGNQEYD
jgi:hypothetical protein